MARSSDVFFDLCLNTRLNIQSKRLWFETPSRSLWRHCNVTKWHNHKKTKLNARCIFWRIYSTCNRTYLSDIIDSDVTWAPWRLKPPQVFCSIFLFSVTTTKSFSVRIIVPSCGESMCRFPSQRDSNAESYDVIIQEVGGRERAHQEERDPGEDALHR